MEGRKLFVLLFEQGAPYFHFVLCPTNYIARPGHSSPAKGQHWFTLAVFIPSLPSR